MEIATTDPEIDRSSELMQPSVRTGIAGGGSLDRDVSTPEDLTVHRSGLRMVQLSGWPGVSPPIDSRPWVSCIRQQWPKAPGQTAYTIYLPRSSV